MKTTLPAPRSKTQERLILLSVTAVATCGLVYELISATMASYMLGNSVTQWSLVIGIYLSAMGLGSWLSKFVEYRVHRRFIGIQLGIAVLGGFSAPALFLGFAHLSSVRPLVFGLLVVIGTMVGLEIPLLMRMMQGQQTLKDLVARVLAFDYLGSLAASLFFPLLLLPHLGLVRTSLLFGLINAGVALWAIWAFRLELVRTAGLFVQAITVTACLGVAFVGGHRLEAFGETQLYDFPVVISRKSTYQRLTITRWHDDVRLFLDGNLQFSSLDEHRYHEALVHPALASTSSPNNVLVLGGGDGMALRELLKDPRVERVDLVDLDPLMTELFGSHPMLTAINEASFGNPRVHIHHADAMEWLARHEEQPNYRKFDVIIVDLPDPNNFSLGKLYSLSFYRLLGRVLAPDAVGVIQSTSPYLAPRSFWCIVKTLNAANLHPLPYHAHVPSFGDWGFVLVSARGVAPPTRLPDVSTRFLSDELLPSLFVFPLDTQPPAVKINRLNDQMLVHYYEADLLAPLSKGRPGRSP